MHRKSDIGSEQNCFQLMNLTTDNTYQSCHIYIMSDQPQTVQLLHEYVQKNTHCTSSTRSSGGNANNTTSSASFRAGHGPRAGRGYWEDLTLAIHARHGIIAYSKYRRPYLRTSTALVREIIDFRNQLEHHGSNISLPPLFMECTKVLTIT
jgi:hypothetical protein